MSLCARWHRPHQGLTSIRPNFCLMASKVDLTLSSEATSQPRPMAWISPGAASPCSTAVCQLPTPVAAPGAVGTYRTSP